MKELPTSDEFFGSNLPTADEFFAPQKPSIATSDGNSNPALDEFLQKTPVGRIMGAFGSGFAEGGEGGNLGIDLGSDTDDSLRKAGVFNDYMAGEHNFAKSVTEAFIRPAAAVIDNEWRGVKAGIGALGGAAMQASHEIGTAIEGNETTPLLEQFTEFALMHKAEVPTEIHTARSLAVIGEPEANYFGLKEPTPEQSVARQKASVSLKTPQKEVIPEQISKSATPANESDIHAIARQISPEIFNEYDELSTKRDTLGKWMSDLSDVRQKDAETSAPHNEEIADLQNKLETANARKTKIYQAKIEDLTEANNKYIEEQVGKDTLDIAHVRESLQKIDYRMRDLSPDVSSAYREAEKSLPQEETKETSQQTSQTIDEAKKNEEPVNIESENVPGIQANLKTISDDVTKKLIKAGRPQEEARAASQLISEHYKAVSDMGWAKGTPEEIYQRDAANIKKGKQTSTTQGKLHIPFDGKNTITLFRKANASTFIHETGHHWLDEMMRYGKAEDAPEELKSDINTVNSWLKRAQDSELTRAQHEKFARGFERYLMEGIAPSQSLANVFAKFKQWLTNIYQTVQKLKSPVTDDIRDVFDRLLSANPERAVIAPEKEAVSETPKVGPSSEIPNETTIPLTGSVASAPKIENSAEIIKQIPEEKGEGKPSKQEERNLERNPNAKLGKAESKFTDKAGNIRLENLNTPEDVNETIREIASQNNNFLPERRGKLSDGEVLDLADASGIDAAYIAKRKVGEAYNAEQMVALRKIFIDSATNLRDLGNKAALGEESDLMAYAEARGRHIMIQENLSGVTAEAGRALRALRAFREIGGEGEAEAIGDFLKENTGLDLFQLQEEAKKLSNLDTTQQISKLINDSKKSLYKDMILEYYINSLISGPVTHLRYSVGNALNALWTPLVEIPTAAGIGKIREVITGKIEPNRVYLGEAGAQLHGLVQGSKNGLQAAATAWKTNVSPALPTEKVSPAFAIKTNVISGELGKVINVPSRVVSAIHSFFKSIRYEQNIQGLAYRDAMVKGLKEGSEEFTKYVADVANNPSDEMMKEATEEALKELFMSPTDYHSFAGKLTAAVNSNLAAKIIMPFMKIGSQITRNAFIERTPLGLLTEGVRDKAFYAEGIPKGDMQLAKMTTGVVLMGGMSALVLEGLANGDGPADPSKRAIWLLNHRPNSIQVGNITIPYQGLGHLGMLMRFSANMTETASGWNGEDGTKLAKSFMEGVTKSVLDENFMRGLKDMLDAVYHPEEYGENYIKQFATNWLPFSVGLGQVAREIDPSQREAHTIFEAAQKRIPLLSEGLMPRRDRFGEILFNGGNDRYSNDPVVQRMESLQMGIGKIDKKIRGVQLTEQQFDDYSRLAGRMTKMRLNNYVAIPQTKNLPPEIQMKTMHSIINDSREKARQVVMMNNPDIIRKAISNKTKP